MPEHLSGLQSIRGFKIGRAAGRSGAEPQVDTPARHVGASDAGIHHPHGATTPATPMRATTASLLVCLCTACAGIEPRPSLSASWSSNYVGRGVLVHDAAVLQPSLDVGFSGEAGTLTTSVWANIDASDRYDARGSTTELDLIVDWSASSAGANWSVGAMQYTFPHSGATPTTELYASLQAAEWPLTPALAVWWDMVEADGVYATLGGGRTFDLSDELALSVSGSVGWMSAGMAAFNYGVDKDAFSDLYLAASLGWQASDSLGLNAGVSWAHVLDAQLQDAYEDDDHASLAVGATFGF